MKFVVSNKDKDIQSNAGILYIVCFTMEGKDLVKIGITTRNIEDRVSEILISIFKKYREFPYCRPKRFKKTTEIFEKEAILHEYFKEHQHKTEKKFSGSTEFFDVPIDKVVSAYENLLEGKPLDESRQK